MRGIVMMAKMKQPRTRATALLVMVIYLFLISVCGEAATVNSETVTAILGIEPQIVVRAESPTVYVSDPGGPGHFNVTLDFTVEANVAQVSMFVEATNFYFENNPQNEEVEPIMLVDSTCEIDPGGVEALNGNIASFIENGDPIDGFPSRKTETLAFRSNSANQMFSHNVAVTPTWNLEPMKPAGNYTAKVKLTCMAIPPE